MCACVHAYVALGRHTGEGFKIRWVNISARGTLSLFNSSLVGLQGCLEVCVVFKFTLT